MLEIADQRSSRMIPETIRFDWSHFSLVAESEHLQQRSLLCMVPIVVPILALGTVRRRGRLGSEESALSLPLHALSGEGTDEASEVPPSSWPPEHSIRHLVDP